jgi:hypothetical protein
MYSVSKVYRPGVHFPSYIEGYYQNGTESGREVWSRLNVWEQVRVFSVKTFTPVVLYQTFSGDYILLLAAHYATSEMQTYKTLHKKHLVNK